MSSPAKRRKDRVARKRRVKQREERRWAKMWEGAGNIVSNKWDASGLRDITPNRLVQRQSLEVTCRKGNE